MTEVCAGVVRDLPEHSCVAIGDGRAIVVRHGSVVRAFPNRCLHQDSPLAGGWVRDGVLTCPQHFWRYVVEDGRQLGSTGCLTSLAVRMAGDVAWVEVPDRPAGSVREQLLARARSWDRDRAYQSTKGKRC